jgi:hypothetical protein
VAVEASSEQVKLMPQLVRVEAPHFVAGLVLQDGVCTRAAPILRRFIGQEAAAIRVAIHDQGWRASIVSPWARDVRATLPSSRRLN